MRVTNLVALGLFSLFLASCSKNSKELVLEAKNGNIEDALICKFLPYQNSMNLRKQSLSILDQFPFLYNAKSLFGQTQPPDYSILTSEPNTNHIQFKKIFISKTY